MRYFLGLLIALGLIVLVFILVLKGFSGQPATPTKPLVDYATTNIVAELTINGPVIANQTHQALQITVGQSQAQINILQGYEGTVVNTKIYANNQAAYGVFLRAIDILNFSKGNADPAKADERGYCPEGDSYVYELNNGVKDIERYWATSCGNQGTFKGNALIINDLFEKQIPDYGTLTQSLQL